MRFYSIIKINSGLEEYDAKKRLNLLLGSEDNGSKVIEFLYNDFNSSDEIDAKEEINQTKNNKVYEEIYKMPKEENEKEIENEVCFRVFRSSESVGQSFGPFKKLSVWVEGLS